MGSTVTLERVIKISWVCVVLQNGVLGKPRPRYTTKNGKAYAYTPKKFQDCETKIAYEYERQDGSFYDACEVTVQIIVCRKQPKSIRRKNVEEISDTLKPDIDNVAKLVLDALNGCAYTDDCQVTSLSIDKHPRRKIDYDCIFLKVDKSTSVPIRRKIWDRLCGLYLKYANKVKANE